MLILLHYTPELMMLRKNEKTALAAVV